MTSWGSAVELVPGDPVAVGDFGSRLLVLAGGFADASTRVGLIEANGWKGQAAAAFRTVKDLHARAFDGAAQAFGAAGLACRSYAGVLAEAQGQAGQAVRLHAEAQTATQVWQARRAACRSAVQAAAAGSARSGGLVIAVDEAVLRMADPGEGGRLRADALLADARGRVAAAAGRAAAQLRVAADAAPRRHQSWVQAWFCGPGGAGQQAREGATQAVLDVLTAGWDTSPVGLAAAAARGDSPDWRRLLATGRVWAGLPSEQRYQAARAAAGQLVDADDWRAAPARAAGYTLANAALLLAGDGTGDAGEVSNGAVAARAARAAHAQSVEEATALVERDRRIVTGSKQLQKKYKHAKDLGVDSPYNGASGESFNQAIRDFVSEYPTVRGTYRRQGVLISFDTATRVAVVRDLTGTFISCWRLSPEQWHWLMTKGSLGGG